MVDPSAVKRAHGYHPLRVHRVVSETADTRTYVLDAPPDVADLFGYRPGQFCTFRVRLNGEEHLRSYSMSSAPDTDDRLAVTVKRVPGGLISNWFHDHVAEGDTLEATRPSGVFCTRDDGRTVTAFCGGSGVTPVMSITKSALAATDRTVRVLYANRDRDSVIFAEEFASLRGAHGERLQVRHHLDDELGLVTAEEVRELAAHDLHAHFFVCGPLGFMDLVEATLVDLGVAPEQISIERFDHAEAASAAGSPDTDTGDGEGTVDEEVPAEVTVVLQGKATTIAYQPGDTLLETARRGGLRAPYSCEAGNCATCMALLHAGTVTMRANNALSDDEVADGWVLTCQSIPHGREVKVEYESF